MTVAVETDVSRALAILSNVFASLGRDLLCLDENFRVIHAPPDVHEIQGRAVADILGKDLFGPGAPLREALLAGERREGWRALLQTSKGVRLLSITAAPLIQDPAATCDPRVKYLVVILPAEEDHFAIASAPTVLAGLIARSPAMSRIFELVENLQASETPVLLTGEKGTGKEVVARAIHEHSPRRRGPFVSVNCAAFPPEMLESELFGYVRGAFPGAVRDRLGRVDLAAQGTLFLEDVNVVPDKVLSKLIAVNHGARIIASSTDELNCDFFEALRPVRIEIPPLRARREDIEPLTRLLLRRIGERHGRHLRLSPEAMRAFLSYSWPGNVRELETAIELAAAVAKGAVIQSDDLPVEIVGTPVEAVPDTVAITESQRLRAVLEAHRWRREQTAHALGISRATLWRRMREHGLL